MFAYAMGFLRPNPLKKGGAHSVRALFIQLGDWKWSKPLVASVRPGEPRGCSELVRELVRGPI